MSVRQVKPHERFPNGGRYILYLYMTPDAMTSTYGLIFENEFSVAGLGTFDFCALELRSGDHVWMGRYDIGPIEGVMVIADQGADVDGVQRQILGAFSLTEADVEWKLEINIALVADALGWPFGIKIVESFGNKELNTPDGPQVILDRIAGTARLFDSSDPTWNIIVNDDNGSFLARVTGSLPPKATQALSHVDELVGFRLRTDPESLRSHLNPGRHPTP